MDEITPEIERRLEEIRSEPGRLKRYDLNGDGVIDASEWEEVRRVVTLEVQTEHERRRSAGADAGETHDAVLAERFEVGEEIGRGAHGRTYRGRDLDSGAVVAIKQLNQTIIDHLRVLEEHYPDSSESFEQAIAGLQ